MFIEETTENDGMLPLEEIIPTLETRLLNPAKGWTVLTPQEVEVTINFPSYEYPTHIKSVQILLDSEYEITISPFTWGREVMPLIAKLHEYTKSKILPLNGRSFYIEEFDIACDLSADVAEIGPLSIEDTDSVLEILESTLFEKGIKRLHIYITNGKDGLAPVIVANEDNVILYKKLEAQGYRSVLEMKNFMTGNHETILTKDLEQISSVQPVQIIWDEEEDELDTLPELCEGLGIFIRNSDGVAKGMAWCSVEKNAAIPHVYVNAFFIDETIRGTGFGKVIMSHLENHVKTLDINRLLLSTGDVNAPWFYEKIGYQKLGSIPKIAQDLAGNDVDMHYYSKKI